MPGNSKMHIGCQEDDCKYCNGSFYNSNANDSDARSSPSPGALVIDMDAPSDAEEPGASTGISAPTAAVQAPGANEGEQSGGQTCTMRVRSVGELNTDFIQRVKAKFPLPEHIPPLAPLSSAVLSQPKVYVGVWEYLEYHCPYCCKCGLMTRSVIPWLRKRRNSILRNNLLENHNRNHQSNGTLQDEREVPSTPICKGKHLRDSRCPAGRMNANRLQMQQRGAENAGLPLTSNGVQQQSCPLQPSNLQLSSGEPQSNVQQPSHPLPPRDPQMPNYVHRPEVKPQSYPLPSRDPQMSDVGCEIKIRQQPYFFPPRDPQMSNGVYGRNAQQALRPLLSGNPQMSSGVYGSDLQQQLRQLLPRDSQMSNGLYGSEVQQQPHSLLQTQLMLQQHFYQSSTATQLPGYMQQQQNGLQVEMKPYPQNFFQAQINPQNQHPAVLQPRRNIFQGFGSVILTPQEITPVVQQARLGLVPDIFRRHEETNQSQFNALPAVDVQVPQSSVLLQIPQQPVAQQPQNLPSGVADQAWHYMWTQMETRQSSSQSLPSIHTLPNTRYPWPENTGAYLPSQGLAGGLNSTNPPRPPSYDEALREGHVDATPTNIVNSGTQPQPAAPSKPKRIYKKRSPKNPKK